MRVCFRVWGCTMRAVCLGWPVKGQGRRTGWLGAAAVWMRSGTRMAAPCRCVLQAHSLACQARLSRLHPHITHSHTIRHPPPTPTPFCTRQATSGPERLSL